MWIVPAAVVVLGAIAFLLLKGGAGGGILGGPDNTIPKFDFEVRRAIPVSVATKDVKTLRGPAKQVANDVGKTMTDLYKEAFLDPANWRDGSYDEVWPLFDGEAATAAQGDVEVLTVGAQAGAGYDTVQPVNSKLSVKVLMDDRNEPTTAVAIVEFAAQAKGKDGTYTAIVSSGQFFLHETGDGWRVFSYRVTRDDHPTMPKPGPSGSPTAVAS